MINQEQILDTGDVRSRYPGVHPFTDRHGRLRWRYRKNGRDISLAFIPGTHDFDAAYNSAVMAVATGGKAITKIRRSKINPSGIRGNFPSCIDRVLKNTCTRAASLKRSYNLDHNWMIATLEDQGYRCLMTNLPFSAEGGFRNPYAPSIDRIDNKKGYTRDNVRLVLHSVNLALNDFGSEHFDVICAARLAVISENQA